MAKGTKRLDLQFGSFACSVQGFDDPVEPVQQVLRALQTVLEESPEIGTAGIAFDAETIEQLTGEIARRADIDEPGIEIVPGLVIVHHGGLQGLAPDAPEESGYVNIFAPAAGGAADFDDPAADYPPEEFTDDFQADEYPAEAAQAFPESFGEDDGAAADAPAEALKQDGAGSNHSDLIADRLGRMRDDSPARDIFADGSAAATGTNGAHGANIFADPMAGSGGSGAAAESGATNFFSEPLTPKQSDDARDVKSGAASDGASSDAVGEAVTLQLFTSDRSNNGAGEADPFPAGETPAEEDDEANGFSAARMAESAEASSIPDLMASAAAWMVLIKGQTTFSRKDVIGVFETIPGEHDDSLQAQIKGFGKAVRNGQLVMVEDGVFGLSRKELERFQRML